MLLERRLQNGFYSGLFKNQTRQSLKSLFPAAHHSLSKKYCSHLPSIDLTKCVKRKTIKSSLFIQQNSLQSKKADEKENFYNYSQSSFEEIYAFPKSQKNLQGGLNEEENRQILQKVAILDKGIIEKRLMKEMEEFCLNNLMNKEKEERIFLKKEKKNIKNKFMKIFPTSEKSLAYIPESMMIFLKKQQQYSEFWKRIEKKKKKKPKLTLIALKQPHKQ